MRRPRRYDTAASRWEGLGPYYAMFPTAFADGVVGRYTRPADVVLDPFAGRGTALFSAAKRGRVGLGIELNPVGWVYARTKLSPAPFDAVLGRLGDVEAAAPRYRRSISTSGSVTNSGTRGALGAYPPYSPGLSGLW